MGITKILIGVKGMMWKNNFGMRIRAIEWIRLPTGYKKNVKEITVYSAAQLKKILKAFRDNNLVFDMRFVKDVLEIEFMV